MRAFAILVVIAYHLGHMPSGFFGVDVFFVLSGYLITGLLADESRRRGAISLARFYGRRAFRLLPALFTMVLGCLIVGSIVLPEQQVHDLWWSSLFVLTYTANFRAIDYSTMPLLAHTWSLAVEEQFYLLWPLAFARVIGWTGPRRLAGWLLAGATVSALWCAIDYERGASLARLSDLPDTHAAGLLVGSALALLLGPGGVGLPGWAERPLHVASYVSALVLAVGCRAVLAHGAFPYMGGFLVVSALTGVILIDQTSATPSKLAVVLRRPLAVLIGRWSYSLYLVHLPIIELLQRTDIPAPEQIPLAVILSFLLAAALYLAVERPALRLRHRLDRFSRHSISATGRA